MATPDQHLDETRAQGIAELGAFLRIPLISSQPDQADNVRRAAAYLAEQDERIGLVNIEGMPIPGHPVVYAHRGAAPSPAPALVYAHSNVLTANSIGACST